jgi:hypothetical protein
LVPLALAIATQAQFGLGGDDARLGLAQLVLKLHVRHPRGQRRQLVIQRSRQFDTAGDAAVANDGGIGAQLITNQLHGLTHIGGEKTLNLHKPLPQPLGPTVATMVTCLLSGISWYANTCKPDCQAAKRDSIARIGPATSRITG